METETNRNTSAAAGIAGIGQIPERVYFRIGDVAEIVGVKPYVLRYWESEFPMISPEKSSTGQRVYRRGDVESLLLIKHLLYQERYSIEGARRRLRELRRDGELKTFKQEKVASVLAASSEALAEEVRQASGETSALAEVAESLLEEEFIEVRELTDDLEIVQFMPAERSFLAVVEEAPVVAATPSAVFEVAPVAPVAMKQETRDPVLQDPGRLERLSRMKSLAEELETLASMPVDRLFPSLT